MNKELLDLATRAVEYAQKKGAQQAAVSTEKGRFIELQYRDGKLEKIAESASSGLGLDLYIDGRYSAHRTSDLRWDSLAAFIDQAAAMTRLITEDPNRGLADPALYENRPEADLEILDGGYDRVDTSSRKDVALAVEAAARAVKGPIISVTSGYYDVTGEAVQVHSNGFAGHRASTQFWSGAEVSVEDEDGKKPEDYHWVGTRYREDLPDADAIGKEASRRALSRRGQQKLGSASMTIVLENRTASRLLRYLIGAMSGGAIQQKRSFLLDSLGKSISSDKLSLVDEPLMPRAFGSRHYDGDGISARKRTLVADGVLQEYLIDVYYGRKLNMDPTGGSTSNLIIPPGSRSADEIIGSLDHAIYVTGILGGNADPTSGDFSHGIHGFEIKCGKVGAPVGEMNITGNHTKFWNRLVEVGNDPYIYSTYRTPTFVFEDVAVSGS